MSRKDRTDKPQPLERSAIASDAAARLGTIVEAAERAAEQVIDDAEKQARQRLSEAEAEADRIAAERLGSLEEAADAIAAQTEAIRREAERLIEAVERVKADLGSDVRAPQPLAPTPHLTAVAPAEEPPEVRPASAPVAAESQAEAPEPELERGTPAGARLLATQMAVSGSSREEIELRLKNGFEIEDTAAILDAILGPEE